jgi:hypothetical protein
MDWQITLVLVLMCFIYSLNLVTGQQNFKALLVDIKSILLLHRIILF